MSVISFIISVCTFAFGLWVYSWQSRRTRDYRRWEAQLLSDQVGIPLNYAQDVVNGVVSLEALEKQAWKLVKEYGCDFKTACKIRDGEISHSGFTKKNGQYPFSMNPIQESPGYFHIYEMANEPPSFINGSNTNTWGYQGDSKSNITHVFLAGHANGPVCKQISSLIYNTYLGMESVSDSLLVPGACLLQEPVDVSRLDIKLQPPITLKPHKQDPPPLKKFFGDLQPFQQDIGLSNVQPVGNKPYWKLEEKVHDAILKHQNSASHVLLRGVKHGSNVEAMFLPFWPLGVKSPVPVSFELPISEFESDDFTYLKEVHHQSLILEMTGDAERRKRIYQDWLKRDEESYERYGRYYRGLSNEEKIAQNIQVSGSRNFVNATVTKALQNGKEVYTSPKAYYENTLPSLIKMDKEWIGKMDDIISNLKSRDKIREHRISEVNLAVLIDSFLRGWPPVFLGGNKEDEGQQRYLRWCEEKRGAVWKAIYQQLVAEQIRIEPFLEENTIFQIQFINDKVLKFTPFYVVTDNDLLIYLSPNYGVTYYVNKWSRRKLNENNIPVHTSNWEQAHKYYQQGTEWLDRPSTDTTVDEATAINRGVEAFRFALETHPAIVQEIWNGWWQRFSQDTSQYFENFKNLAKGFRAYNDANYELSRTYLKQFIELYPDVLPDPYVLLAFQELQLETNTTPLLAERHMKLNRYHTIEEKIKNIEGFLKSNKPIFGKIEEKIIKRIGQNPTLVSGLTRPFSPATLKDKGIIDKAEQQKLEDIEDKTTELTNLRMERTQLVPELNSLNEKIDQGNEVIWNTLQSKTIDYIQKARDLAPDYVETILNTKKISFSDFYAFRFNSLREILQGDEYIDIANKLHQSSFKLDRKKLTTAELKDEIAHYFQVEYLDKDNLKELQDFQDKLDNLLPEDDEVSAIVREMILRKEIDQIVKTYFHKGVKIYEQSAYLLPEFTEPIHRLTELYGLKYKKSLQYMFNRTVPIRNFSLGAKFTTLSNEKLKVKKIWFDQERNIIVGSDKNDDQFDLVQIKNLTNEELGHLKQQLDNPRFQVSPIGRSALSSAEIVLNSLIVPSPVSRRWSKALLEIEDWLIRLIAYLGVLPIPSKEPINDKLLKLYEGKPRVDGIDLDVNRLQEDFLKEIGVPAKDVSVIEIDFSEEAQPTAN